MGNACSTGGPAIDPQVAYIEYFPIHGRAEPIRALLHHAGVRYVDQTVGIGTWMMRKNNKETGEMG